MKVLLAITFTLVLVYYASAEETARTEKRSADEKHEQHAQFNVQQHHLEVQPKEEKWSQPDESLNDEEFHHQQEWESLKLQAQANNDVHQHKLQIITQNHEEPETVKEHDISHIHHTQKSHDVWVPKKETIIEKEPNQVLIKEHLSPPAPFHHKVPAYTEKQVHYHADRPVVHPIEITAKNPTFYSYEVIHTPKSPNVHQLPHSADVHSQSPMHSGINIIPKHLYHNKHIVHHQPSHSLEITNPISAFRDDVEKPSHGDKYLHYHTGHSLQQLAHEEKDIHLVGKPVNLGKPISHHAIHREPHSVELSVHPKPYYHDNPINFIQKIKHVEKPYQMVYSHPHIVDNQKLIHNDNHVISFDKQMYPEKQVYHHGVQKDNVYLGQQHSYANNHISDQPNHGMSLPVNNVHFANQYSQYNSHSGSHILYAPSNVQKPLYTEKHLASYQANHLIPSSVVGQKHVYSGHHKNLIEKPLYQHAYHKDHPVQYPLVAPTIKPVHSAFDEIHAKKPPHAEKLISYHVDQPVPWKSVGAPVEQAVHKDINVIRVSKPFNIHVEKPYPVYVHHPVYVEKPLPLKVVITNDKNKNSLWH